ncbi:MAG: glycosyltransferase WbuB [Anaerolineae bacterium]|jgi:colanic acid biosynthesis glycosyl transferase WcaI|nr:glycosyltransferase WbuB [Anaerolineae bacterium]
MRLLIIGLNFHPDLTGIGKYTGEMAAYLAAKGHEVRVICAPPYYPQWAIVKPYAGWRYQQEQWSGVDVVRCPLWVPKKPSGIKRLLHLFSFTLSSFPVVLMQRKWKPEIIINVAPSLLSALPALLLAQLTGAKTWLHIQDFELDAAFSLGLLQGGKWIFRLAQKLELALFKRFDQVSTISEHMQERLWQKGVAREKTVLVPNWIDTDLIKPLSNAGAFREEWQIADNQIVILYSGNMGRKQGLEILIDTARSLIDLPEILFLLCGDGVMREELEKSAQTLPNIHFYPLQPLEKLNDLLNLADIHILPQRADAADLVMPSKLSGILASGKAVIATASSKSELGEIVNDVGILTSPGNTRELSNAIHRLAKSPKKRAFLGNKGRKWVVSRWAREKVLDRFEKNLEGMLES